MAAGLFLFFSTSLNLDAQVVLRNLTLLDDRTVADFSTDQVRLDDGTVLSWDSIFEAKVEPDRQADFDRYVREIGLPLFRLKKRIEVRDWRRLNEIAEQLMVRYSGEDSTVGKTVCLAAMKGRIEVGQATQAVIPFLLASQKRSRLSPETLESLGMNGDEILLGMTRHLLPVWFDTAGVADGTKSLQAFRIEEGDRFSDGGKIYLGSFLLFQAEFERAESIVRSAAGVDPVLREWKSFLLGEISRRASSGLITQNPFVVKEKTLPEIKALSQFWDARAAAQLPNKQPKAQMLAYLKVAALWGEQFPRLASASIYEAIVIAKSANLERESDKLTKELLRSFPSSYHRRVLTTAN